MAGKPFPQRPSVLGALQPPAAGVGGGGGGGAGAGGGGGGTMSPLPGGQRVAGSRRSPAGGLNASPSATTVSAAAAGVSPNGGTISMSATAAMNALDRQNSVKSGLGANSTASGGGGGAGASGAAVSGSKAVLDRARNQLASNSGGGGSGSPAGSMMVTNSSHHHSASSKSPPKPLTGARLKPLTGAGAGDGVSPTKDGGSGASEVNSHPASAGRTRGVSALAPARPPNARPISGRPSVSRHGSQLDLLAVDSPAGASPVGGSSAAAGGMGRPLRSPSALASSPAGSGGGGYPRNPNLSPLNPLTNNSSPSTTARATGAAGGDYGSAHFGDSAAGSGSAAATPPPLASTGSMNNGFDPIFHPKLPTSSSATPLRMTPLDIAAATAKKYDVANSSQPNTASSTASSVNNIPPSGFPAGMNMGRRPSSVAPRSLLPTSAANAAAAAAAAAAAMSDISASSSSAAASQQQSASSQQQQQSSSANQTPRTGMTPRAVSALVGASGSGSGSSAASQHTPRIGTGNSTASTATNATGSGSSNTHTPRTAGNGPNTPGHRSQHSTTGAGGGGGAGAGGGGGVSGGHHHIPGTKMGANSNASAGGGGAGGTTVPISEFDMAKMLLNPGGNFDFRVNDKSHSTLTGAATTAMKVDEQELKERFGAAFMKQGKRTPRRGAASARDNHADPPAGAAAGAAPATSTTARHLNVNLSVEPTSGAPSPTNSMGGGSGATTPTAAGGGGESGDSGSGGSRRRAGRALTTRTSRMPDSPLTQHRSTSNTHATARPHNSTAVQQHNLNASNPALPFSATITHSGAMGGGISTSSSSSGTTASSTPGAPGGPRGSSGSSDGAALAYSKKTSFERDKERADRALEMSGTKSFLDIGVAWNIGVRKQMEDAHIVRVPFGAPPVPPAAAAAPVSAVTAATTAAAGGAAPGATVKRKSLQNLSVGGILLAAGAGAAASGSGAPHRGSLKSSPRGSVTTISGGGGNPLGNTPPLKQQKTIGGAGGSGDDQPLLQASSQPRISDPKLSLTPQPPGRLSDPKVSLTLSPQPPGRLSDPKVSLGSPPTPQPNLPGNTASGGTTSNPGSAPSTAGGGGGTNVSPSKPATAKVIGSGSVIEHTRLNSGFFGIFDGHGGRTAVEFVERNLHKYVERELLDLTKAPQQALEWAFLRTDKEMAGKTEFKNCGSTAACVYVRPIPNSNSTTNPGSSDPSDIKRELYVANVGDARVVLGVQRAPAPNAAAGASSAGNSSTTGSPLAKSSPKVRARAGLVDTQLNGTTRIGSATRDRPRSGADRAHSPAADRSGTGSPRASPQPAPGAAGGGGGVGMSNRAQRMLGHEPGGGGGSNRNLLATAGAAAVSTAAGGASAAATTSNSVALSIGSHNHTAQPIASASATTATSGGGNSPAVRSTTATGAAAAAGNTPSGTSTGATTGSGTIPFQAIRLSYDHTAHDPSEVARITQCGGHIWGNRVNGMLAVTRAFGDYTLKHAGVYALPYVARVGPINSEHKFVIIACDGVWDVMSDAEAVNHIAHMKDANKMAHALVHEALRRGTGDNVSAIVIRLHNNFNYIDPPTISGAQPPTAATTTAAPTDIIP